VPTLNYSAIADFHTFQTTPAHAKSFPARSVFTSSCLATAFNDGYSSASGIKSSLNDSSLATAFSCFSCPLYNPFERTEQKIPFTTVPLLILVTLKIAAMLSVTLALPTLKVSLLKQEILGKTNLLSLIRHGLHRKRK
jgi:hypothetical protein